MSTSTRVNKTRNLLTGITMQQQWSWYFLCWILLSLPYWINDVSINTSRTTTTTHAWIYHPSIVIPGSLINRRNPSKRLHHKIFSSSGQSSLFSTVDDDTTTSTSTSATTTTTTTTTKKTTTIQKTKPTKATTRRSSKSHVHNKIITCSTAKELATAISKYVKSYHVVAELGSQLRLVSNEIYSNCQSAVFVDVTRGYPKSSTGSSSSTTTTVKEHSKSRADERTKAMRLLDHVNEFFNKPISSSSTSFDASSASDEKAKFIEIESLQDWSHAFFPIPTFSHSMEGEESSEKETKKDHQNRRQECYNVFVLDLSAIVGNDLEWTSWSIIQQFETLNKMQRKRNTKAKRTAAERDDDNGDNDDNEEEEEDFIILVKSDGLNQFASHLFHAHHWINRPRQDISSTTDEISSTTDEAMSTSTNIVAAVGVQEYRDTIPRTIRNEYQDVILEIGCHFGTTTSLLYDVSNYCIGVDIGTKIIQQAKKKYPFIYFHVGDAWKTASLLRIQQKFLSQQEEEEENENDKNGTNVNTTSQQRLSSQRHHHHHNVPLRRNKIGFDVVYIDVGGLSGSNGLLEAIQLIQSIQYALEPRVIVIKSLCVRRLSTRLMSYWNLQKEEKEEKRDREKKKKKT